jgi:hypothetical protein
MNLLRNPRRMARPPYVGGGEIAMIEIATTVDADVVPAATEKNPPKQTMVVAMLRGTAGASLAELVAATGWQAHTTRAALTGLRKKNHAIERFSVDGETRYRIVASDLA